MLQISKTGPPVEGWLDLNLNLNFAPQMRKEYLDFLYSTREMAMAQLFDIQWLVVAGVAFLVGVLLTTCIALLVRRRDLRHAAAVIAACFIAATPVFAQSGNDVMVDLTTLGYVKKNIASRINGAGCCVFASQDASFRSQYATEMDGYLEWVGSNLPGGGYPSRVSEYMDAFCRKHNIAVPDYTQIVGDDSIQAIRDALEDGRSPAVTYSGDPSFYGGPVPHMVNCVYLDDQRAAVVDNNRPGEVEWMSRETFIKRHRHFDRGWAIVYHGKPQVPRPTNPIPPSRADPLRNFRLSLRDGDALVQYAQDCPTCPPRRGPRLVLPDRESSQPAVADPVYEWRGDVLYRDGVRVGERVNGVYHIYRGDGSGRSWLEPAPCPADTESRGDSKRPTGVDYAKVPRPLPGHTYYGTQSSDLRYDESGRRVYESKILSDRAKPRIIINIDGAEEVIRDLLRRLQALERVFIYARDAFDVIRRMGYAPGITVVSGTTRGVAMEAAYFETVPTEDQLREALIRSDPSYRPGSSGPVGASLDTPAMALVAVIAILAGCIVFLVARRGAASHD